MMNVPAEHVQFDNLPDIFEVEYIAACGNTYLMINCLVPRVYLYCEDCREQEYFYSQAIIYGLTEDHIIDDDKDFFGDSRN